MSKAIFDQVTKEEFEKTLLVYQDLVGKELIEITSAETISYYDERFELVPNKVTVPIILFFIRLKEDGNEYYIINTQYLLDISKDLKEEA